MCYTPLSILYKLLYRCLKVYWFVFRPRTRGVRCIVECDDKILLIRHTYGDSKWHLPGGGIKRGESPEDAGRRETREEVGLELTNVRLLGAWPSLEGYNRDTTHYFHGLAASTHYKVNRHEVRAAGWFEWVSLPDHLSRDAKRIIGLYRSTPVRL